MFTVEHDFADTIITVLDDTGHLEDLEVMFDEYTVFFRQWDEVTGAFHVIEITTKQFKELQAALSLPEGAYRHG